MYTLDGKAKKVIKWNSKKTTLNKQEHRDWLLPVSAERKWIREQSDAGIITQLVEQIPWVEFDE